MSFQPLIGPFGTTIQGSAPTRTGMTANAEAKEGLFGALTNELNSVLEQAPAILGEAAVNELRKATHTQTVNAFDKPNGLGLSGTNGNAPSSGFSIDGKTLLIGGGLVLGAVALFALS